jgi:tol-pal system protein YbgF
MGAGEGGRFLGLGSPMKSFAAAVISFAMTATAISALAQTPRPAPDGAYAATGRIERLEQRVSELNAVVAAVETLAKNNGGGSGYASAATGGASSEQVRQLSEQLADLQQRLERLEARLGANTDPSGEQPRRQTGYNTMPPASGFEDKEQLPPLSAPQPPADRYASRPPVSAPPPQQTASAYQQLPSARPYGADPAPRPAVAASPANSSARTLFDQATGSLNRREYAAAETYFKQFLDQYPSDPMAGSAQYWLGETAFLSGEYRAAADRFLKTFTSYPNSERAPEALLKLAIALRRLGENAAACDSFAELQRRYPQGPKTILQRADVEKKRANCA